MWHLSLYALCLKCASARRYLNLLFVPVSLYHYYLHQQQQQHAVIPAASLVATQPPIGWSSPRWSPIGWQNQTLFRPGRQNPFGPNQTHILTNQRSASGQTKRKLWQKIKLATLHFEFETLPSGRRFKEHTVLTSSICWPTVAICGTWLNCRTTFFRLFW